MIQYTTIIDAVIPPIDQFQNIDVTAILEHETLLFSDSHYFCFQNEMNVVTVS